MGDGEFQGGGSVTWRVRNTYPSLTKCTLRGARGKDPDPKDDDGFFRVVVNGRVVAKARVYGTRVNVQWGRDAVGPLPPAPPKGGKPVAARRRPAGKIAKSSARPR